jgi:FixJ family two-component response regulator
MSPATKEPAIAVIDDDEPFRAALVESLHSYGYGARGFSSAEEFIAMQGELSWDCVITDVHMPGMSGFDLKALLAADNSKVPVIMVTARAEPNLEARAAACGVIGLLRKPFAAAVLLGYLKRVLDV